jgi:transposase
LAGNKTYTQEIKGRYNRSATWTPDSTISLGDIGSKYLRWVLLECVHVHIRTNKHSKIARFYVRLARRKGSSIAAVAAAAKLLKVVY